jgi:phosphoribosylaminoimidazolecarboxamide formyltransferase / IMP cyclohydrolase
MSRALLSVYEKDGVVDLARGLADLGWDLVASGGTADALERAGVEATRVEQLTEVPELLGGRVKTLHPRIHAAILARHDLEDDLATLDEHAIEPFDLVCVNLYPFERVATRYGVKEQDAVELIDIGGPSMLRGAAKNFAHVAAVSHPSQYAGVLAELAESGELSYETRRGLAADAFAATAAYEAAIARWFADRSALPQSLTLSFAKVLDLAYGENPHQRAAYYSERGARTHLLSRVEQVHGKPLSFNNLNDLDAARSLVRGIALPACVVVKHANPCGVAVAPTIEEAYERAHASDPLSAYGGVITLNRPVGAELAETLSGRFVEVLLAPEIRDEAVETLTAKPSLRILIDRERRAGDRAERDVKRVLGGLLVQDADLDVDERAGMTVVCGAADEAAWGDLLFAWRVCQHVTSNAIVVVKALRTIGIGAGQQSRVDAVRIALDKAREHGHDLSGAALASDAFFPFTDGPQLALEAGVRFIVQPGGSKRDDEVTAAVEAAGATMVHTGRRHFRH